MVEKWTHLRVSTWTHDRLLELMERLRTSLQTGRDPKWFTAGKITVNSVLTNLVERELERMDKGRTRVRETLPRLLPPGEEPSPATPAGEQQPADHEDEEQQQHLARMTFEMDIIEAMSGQRRTEQERKRRSN